MAVIAYPTINGVRYDFSSVEINIDGTLFNGVKEITYKQSLEPGELRGTRAQLIGRTRGKYSAEATLTMFKTEYQQLVAALSAKGLGYMETAFDIVVNHSEAAEGVVTDLIVGCRIKDDEDSGSEGSDPLVVKVSLHVMRINRNGANPLSPKQMLL